MCDKTFKKKETLIDHRRVHLRVKLPGTVMDLDSNRISTETSVIEIKGLNSEVDFECPTCGICLSNQQMLDLHLQQHEMATEKFSCKHCDKVFFSDNLLAMHCVKDHKLFPQIKVSVGVGLKLFNLNS